MSITARYRGKCAACGDWFPAGTEIEQTEGDWHHAACPETTDDYDVKHGVCSTCFLTITASGACGCED